MPTMEMRARLGVRLTPALFNLTRLLALPTLSLYQAVQQELIENPALEEVEVSGSTCPRCGGGLVDRMCVRCWRCVADQSVAWHTDDTDPLQSVAAPQTLSDTLLADLYASLPTSEHPIALVVVGSLDQHGLLHETSTELAAQYGIAVERVALVIKCLRELGPPGIGTHNLRECLLAQLDALAAEDLTLCPYARTIIADHLDDLCARRYPAIARQLGITIQEVETARTFIQHHLWPYPAVRPLSSCVSEPDPRQYHMPDMIISDSQGGLHLELVLSAVRLRVNPLYKQLADIAATLSADERKHVQEYTHRTQMFLANLHQRETTLQRVGEAIVARQQQFLRKGVRYLTKMTRLEISAAIGLHESTVCRAIANKTALLPNDQLWCLSDLFVAARPVQDVMRELIANESQPLSDQQLARLLSDQGFMVARRTVAKYREQMNIVPCQLR